MKTLQIPRASAFLSAAIIGTSMLQVKAAHSVNELGAGLSALDLVNNLIGGTGITVTPGSVNYVGAEIASGTFSGATPEVGLPFSSGILLTSGSVYNSVGPNTQNDASQNNNLGGNSLLETVTGINQTFDATLLSFKFTSSLPVFSFRYVFASEEYNEWAPSDFNDVFAFILTDSANSSINLATLPDTTPVSVNNIRLGQNESYYYNNSLVADSGGPASSSLLDIQYDGLVGRNAGFPLFARGVVIPGEEYTITLAISDTGDHVLDSGVFLKQGSFIAGEPEPEDDGNPVPEPASIGGAILLTLLATKKSFNRSH